MAQHRTSVGAVTSIQSVQQAQCLNASLYKPSSDVLEKPDLHLHRKVNGFVSTSAAVGTILPNWKKPRLSTKDEGYIKPSLIKPCSVQNEVNEVDNGPSPYTQRILAASTPTSSLNPLLSLSHPRYGLPQQLVENLAGMGIRSIYPWQSSCLLGHGLLSGEKNLVYSAPTGGGKSLVADVLMLKKVIDNPGQKAILVLPYVALVQEKTAWLRRAVNEVSKRLPDQPVGADDDSAAKWARNHEESKLRVVGFFGGSKARATWSDVDIAICTIEKANALINNAIEQCSIGDLGILVIDELHMIDDEHRGYLIELMATKLLSLSNSVQICGMSATLTNISLLATWLHAKHYTSNYKPVPINEYIVYDQSIYHAATSSSFLRTASQLQSTSSTQITPLRKIQPSEHAELKNPMANTVVALVAECVKSGYGALVFCGGRQSTQTTAELISKAMIPEEDVPPLILDRRKDVITELRGLPVGLDEILASTVLAGVAFHHAGLTAEERDIIATAYDQGALRVIVATCTLAAGINLPARRVILQGARVGREIIGPALFRQMRGRAGRKGKDEIGETYLCIQKSDLEDVVQLLEADLPPLASSLTPDKRGIKRALLEVIAIKLVTHQDAIQDYIKRTLLYHTLNRDELNAMVQSTLKDLLDSKLVSRDDEGFYTASRLSVAIVGAALNPEDGIFIHDELEKALKSMVLDGEMHVFYLFTPVQLSGLSDINWNMFRREIEHLDESGERVLGLVGVKPSLVNKMANSGKPLPEDTAEAVHTARTYRRFYTAFMLRDLCNEVPIQAVARKYDIPRGFVQTLAHSCEGFAAGMVLFCERMGWGMLKCVLEHMTDRLRAGARADLLDLARIPYIKSRTARVFWENGYTSIRAIAEADAKDLVPILALVNPKKTKVYGDDEDKYQQKMLLKAGIITSAANRLWAMDQQVDVETDL